jgi:rare lipoprotein A
MLPLGAMAKQVGVASFYSRYHQGRLTASGERFNYNLLTAAHKTLPFGTLVRVTNLATKASVIVTINDRGPFVKGRIIDLSRRAARAIGIEGIAKVSIETLPS